MKQTKRIIIAFCLSVPIITGTATVKAQQVVSAAGNHAGNGAVQLSWTVGEPVISTVSNDNNILTQGMHQSRLTITAIEEVEMPGFEISAYPNPATEFVYLKVDCLPSGESNAKWKDFSFRLYDINGKLLMHRKIESTETEIRMEGYPPSTFFLEVICNDKEIRQMKYGNTGTKPFNRVKTFKITKQ